jgi:NADPH-dependent glutamate synthase beta subunit-like oxidoreductase
MLERGVKRKASEDLEEWNSYVDEITHENSVMQIESLDDEAYNVNPLEKMKQIEYDVVMRKSSQIQKTERNIQFRSVDAAFKFGPKEARFSISFENENDEGVETIKVESELWIFEEGECLGVLIK